MKIKLTVGAAMVLTLGSALAGGLIIQKGAATQAVVPVFSATSANSTEVTPEMIAKWKVTASTTDYSPPMLPI